MVDLKKFNDYELLYLYNLHSEEALQFLLDKYSCLITIKLCAFRVKNCYFDDFRQECMMVLIKAIRNFSETFNKSFYRYAELLIERKIMNLLRNQNSYLKKTVYFSDFDGLESPENIERNNLNYMLLKEVSDINFFGIKEDILNEIFLQGITIEEFSLKYNMSKKDVYNHIYLLRSIIKKNVM